MSPEAHCPNCGCAFELSPGELAAIMGSFRASPPTEDGPKSTRFVIRPELVEQDGVQVLRIVPTPQPKGKPTPS
jgi:hypothetical protein